MFQSSCIRVGEQVSDLKLAPASLIIINIHYTSQNKNYLFEKYSITGKLISSNVYVNIDEAIPFRQFLFRLLKDKTELAKCINI